MNFTLVQKIIARSSRGFILAFHDIEADRMERFLDALSPIRPVHLSELVSRSKSGKSTAGLCAITVDDGVGTTVSALSRICKNRSWPITFFLPTGNLDTHEGIAYQWWRQIKPLLPGRLVELPSGTWDFSRPELVSELSSTLERLWHSAPEEAYRPFLMGLVQAIAEAHGLQTDQLAPPKPVSWPDVAKLSRDHLIRFESHGVSHVAMSALSDDELALEMKRSRDRVSDHTGRSCRHLAYPFGGSQSIGALAPVIARRFYDSAVTMSLGHVDAADPWLLPRIPLYPENSVLLARLKVALRCSRLGGGRSAPETVPASVLGVRTSTPESPVGSSR
jgi:peptidoglycan/xylan/chitin deacetylase (PgdA/CDA1 family)